MIPVICWVEFWTKKQNQVNALVGAGFKGIRLFLNLCDLPYKTGLVYNSTSYEWQIYISSFYQTAPNPMSDWTFEGRPSPNVTTETLKDHIEFCKRQNWLPIICMGYQEELPHNWLGRAPYQQYWSWLGRFAKEFAIFLRDKLGFIRADIEVYNEPTKLIALGFGWDKYCQLSKAMVRGFKSVAGFKAHVFADDIFKQEYLDNVLRDTELMKITDYISTHIGVGKEDEEWNNNLIAKTTQKIKSRYPHLQQALTEMSLNGIWSRLNQLPGNVAMYGLIGAIRNKAFGTATRIDDIWLWGVGDELQVTAPQKAQALKEFNNKFYKPYEIEGDYMILQPEYRFGSSGIGVKFIQKVLNKDLQPEKPLVVDGRWGALTEEQVKRFEAKYQFPVEAKITKTKFRFMIASYPEIWDEIQYSWCIGER